ncbi:hypothetical protein KCMC57_up22060 [Kitasatospora sp. CMC57]|uniref:Outer membrane channel protein CpnT-like N-terminal domain-containing protein n=1 Tax=Kitasatospora sp. CMC57 TaxID=3231513 RepID=A0AB33JRK2_9ACTN
MISGGDLSFQRAGDAFKWTRDYVNEPLLPLPEIKNPVADGLDAGLDSVVKAALDATGLMDMLEQVTGNLAGLTAAAEEWQAQAKAMREVATNLRQGGGALSGQWEGAAAEAFGSHMGEIVAAIDGTAADMDQVAQIISQAAAECQMAETMVIEIIREAIETLIITLAASVAIDILTLGLATAAEALVVEGEIAVFIARVGKVSAELEKALQKLWDAVKEIKTAGRTFKSINEARKAAKELRKLGSMANRGKALKNAIQSPTMENIGEYVAAKGVKTVFGGLKGGLKGGLGAAIGAGDFGEAVTDGLTGDTNVDAVTGQLAGGPKGTLYRVPTTRIEEAFG